MIGLWGLILAFALCFLSGRICADSLVSARLLEFELRRIAHPEDSGLVPTKPDTLRVWLAASARYESTENQGRFGGIVDRASGCYFNLDHRAEVAQVYDGEGLWLRAAHPAMSESGLRKGIGLLRPEYEVRVAQTERDSVIFGRRCLRVELEWIDNLLGYHGFEELWLDTTDNCDISLFLRAIHGVKFYLDGHELLEEELNQLRGLPVLRRVLARVTHSYCLIADQITQVSSDFFQIPKDYTLFPECDCCGLWDSR